MGQFEIECSVNWLTAETQRRTEEAQRLESHSILYAISVFSAPAVVNFNAHFTQVSIDPAL
jgi:hypothetical protein